MVRGTYLLFDFARIPRSRITLATVFSHTASPDARRAAHTRGLPYTRRSTFLFRPDRRTTDNAYKGI